MADPRDRESSKSSTSQSPGASEPAVWNPVQPGENGANGGAGAHDASAAPPRKSKRFRNCLLGCLGTVVLVIVITGATAFILWWMWRSEPKHWTKQQAAIASKSNTALVDDAEQLEKSVINGVTAVGVAAIRPPPEGEVRTIRVPLDEANAWLAVKLGPWLANQGKSLPANVKNVVVATEGKDLVLSAQAQAGTNTQVFSAVLEIQPVLGNGSGGVKVRLKSLRGGRLGLPIGMITVVILSMVGGTDGDAINAAAATDSLTQGIALDQPHKFDASRSILLEGVDCSPNAIELKVRVLPR